MHKKGHNLSYLMLSPPCLCDKPFGRETPKCFVTYALLVLKNQFLAIVGGKEPFYVVLYRVEGTSYFEKLSNDITTMPICQAVYAIEVTQPYVLTD